MNGTFYTREPGPEGEILSGQGVAPGVGLDQLLDLDRPPLRAALEIGSAVADILCIAAEDRHVHGDIRPAHVKVDDQGAVSIEGYGLVRRVTRAPEGQPELPAADIYGLGLVMHASLSKEGLGNLPNDADGHDEVVVDRVLAMDFSSVSTKRWLAEVREFLCKILAFDPAERPAALDAANVLATVASQCPGDDIASWAKRAHLRQAGGRPPSRQVEENLAGPVALPGYFKKGEAPKESARKAPSSKGESTAMWSREKLAAMFAQDDEDDDPPPRPAYSDPAPAREPFAAREPSPDRLREDLPAARPVAAPMPTSPSRAPPAAPPAAQPGFAPPASPSGASSPSPFAAPGITDHPAARPAAPSKPAVVEPMRAPVLVTTPDDEPEPPAGSGRTLMIAGAVVALLVLVCGGAALSWGGYVFMNRPPAATSDAPGALMVGENPAENPAETLAAGTPARATPGAPPLPADPPAATTPARTPTATTPAASAPSATSAATSKPATTSRPSTADTVAAPPATKPAATASTPPAASAAAEPASTAAGGPTYPVKFTAPGREGKIRCGDGQTAEFAGATTLSFAGTVTCLVQIDKGRGAVQVGRSTTVTCSEDAGKVTCTGGS
ncbi:MAG: hypothetical protein EXR69_04300 [Myxococcales bacterium]|nr:hypothetical protein [Myxococcales bacterium]